MEDKRYERLSMQITPFPASDVILTSETETYTGDGQNGDNAAGFEP